eukprot:TRINITY_DN739_c1_g1_i1.p1 TRINITY_DN739_c1_g1~~TRINITY_DN739_c1_g1_i1.p1  ORF type:complete len:440 (+),score=136.26 TRINITY_DN739_c1_g1_i1:132-1451(+)
MASQRDTGEYRYPSWGVTFALVGISTVLFYGLFSKDHGRGNPGAFPSQQQDAGLLRRLQERSSSSKALQELQEGHMTSLPEGKLHVVVTGGAGYIGSHAALRLLEQGYFVTVIDNLSRGNAGAVAALRKAAAEIAATKGPAGLPLRFVHTDLGDRSGVRAALRRGPTVPDLVIHFAAVAYVGESVSEPLLYYRNISMNTAMLLEEMTAARVRSIVFSSTCATYGNPSQLPVTEETPTNPMSPYGSAKLWAEHVLKDWAVAHPEVRVGILRYFNVYGCDPEGRVGEWPNPKLQQKHGRITNACLDAAAGVVPEVRVFGTGHPTPDGTAIRDYIHVTDLVDAHIAVSEKLANPPVLYNVGTGTGVSVRALIAACRRVTSTNFKVSEHAARPGDSPKIYADNSKIVRELGWRPRFTRIEEGLGHCWQWRRKTNHSGFDRHRA